MREFLIVMLAILALSATFGGIAAADDDHDRARQALKAGEIRPLGQIVDDVQHRCNGRVIEVELEDQGKAAQHAWIYHLRVLKPNGNVLWLDVNAATAAIISIRGHDAPLACD